MEWLFLHADRGNRNVTVNTFDNWAGRPDPTANSSNRNSASAQTSVKRDDER